MSLRRLRPDPARSDAELAARTCRGDEAAFDELYRQYGPACYGLARRLLADDGLAQDVVQEVFVAFWQRPERYDPSRGRLAGWLLGITHHRAVDLVRREQGHRRRRAPVEELTAVPDAVDVPEQAELGLRAERARVELAALPEAQRTVLLLAYYGGLTQREIAATLDIPIGTVKSRTVAAMLRMRDTLTGPLGLHEDTP